MDPSCKRIVLLGDIHANLPALEAVLTHARSLGGCSIWNTGDFVGYGAFPDETVMRLQQEGATSVIGNYDLKVLKFPRRKEKWRQSKHPQKWLAFQWAYQNLSETSRAILRSLPQETVLEEGRILLTHGSRLQTKSLSLKPRKPLAGCSTWQLRTTGASRCCRAPHQAFTRQVEKPGS
jgi:predicted phosphodiesterase